MISKLPKIDKYTIDFCNAIPNFNERYVIMNYRNHFVISPLDNHELECYGIDKDLHIFWSKYPDTGDCNIMVGTNPLLYEIDEENSGSEVENLPGYATGGL